MIRIPNEIKNNFLRLKEPDCVTLMNFPKAFLTKIMFLLNLRNRIYYSSVFHRIGVKFTLFFFCLKLNKEYLVAVNTIHIFKPTFVKSSLFQFFFICYKTSSTTPFLIYKMIIMLKMYGKHHKNKDFI